ncbi:hypothetical protein KY290_036572 [Solanum tuberosum]|uniref:Retrovirus-related Pol polyprotein from transposon TNT 1-94-like beta-barrel domain-containing protein n=1 Tax=Solanum tuberosum TaxID=4113 RepID=A0ABQ7TUN9_SOLTU|nr:hypothetical protein KY285_035889 [Solanum tuberosum]KAH0737867.1 hypothetical protein KY290_036572 [Solanum tuberosum]
MKWLILRDMVNNHKTGTDERMTGLPDGQHTIATKDGSVKLSKNLKLGNVLFVPRLKCNLIYVSQLIDEVDCIVQFTKKLCIIVTTQA